MDIQEFQDSASPTHVANYIVGLGQQVNEASLHELESFLKARASGTYDKHVYPRLVLRALVQHGVRGIESIAELIRQVSGFIYPVAMIEALWYAADSKLAPLQSNLPACTTPPTPETVSAAQSLMRDLFTVAPKDPELFSLLIGFLHLAQSHSTSEEQDREFSRRAGRLLGEGSIRLTQGLLRDYEALIYSDSGEEAIQQFLSANPTLIDPLASEVIPKQRLGIEHVTDFVIRRFDDRYVLVEIEKPVDHIFTRNGDFSSGFIHGFGQVLDFQKWVNGNVAYAQTLMPGISTPEGMLIIGLRTHLDPQLVPKLEAFSNNSRAIQVRTFDDLLTQGRTLNRNLHPRDAWE